jgi:hypothetical protein
MSKVCLGRKYKIKTVLKKGSIIFKNRQSRSFGKNRIRNIKNISSLTKLAVVSRCCITLLYHAVVSRCCITLLYHAAVSRAISPIVLQIQEPHDSHVRQTRVAQSDTTHFVLDGACTFLLHAPSRRDVETKGKRRLRKCEDRDRMLQGGQGQGLGAAWEGRDRDRVLQGMTRTGCCTGGQGQGHGVAGEDRDRVLQGMAGTGTGCCNGGDMVLKGRTGTRCCRGGQGQVAAGNVRTERAVNGDVRHLHPSPNIRSINRGR